LPCEAPAKTKVCRACGKRRSAKFFYKRRRADRKDQLAARCKDCQREEDRKKREIAKAIKDGELEPEINFVPAQPFREWVQGRLHHYESLREFCEVCGLQERRIYELLNKNQKRVLVENVDQALVRDGSAMLWELYPELYE
jgi:hypothetical protein